jgi:hypothetical protein
LEYTSGFAARGDGSSVAIWTACEGGTPWEVKDYHKKIGFYVTEDGLLYSKKADLGFSGAPKNLLKRFTE